MVLCSITGLLRAWNCTAAGSTEVQQSRPCSLAMQESGLAVQGGIHCRGGALITTTSGSGCARNWCGHPHFANVPAGSRAKRLLGLAACNLPSPVYVCAVCPCSPGLLPPSASAPTPQQHQWVCDFWLCAVYWSAAMARKQCSRIRMLSSHSRMQSTHI